MKPQVTAVLFICVLFITTIRCVKSSSTATGKNTELISEAKNYFIQEVAGRVQNDKVDTLIKTPIWDSASTREYSLGTLVEVPIQLKRPYILKLDQGRISISQNILTFLVMYKDLQQKWNTEVITKLPDVNYVNAVSNRVNPGFTGIAVVRNWENQFVKGIRYNSDQTSNAVFLNTPAEKNNAKGIQPQYVQLPECTTYEWYSCAWLVSHPTDVYCTLTESDTYCTGPSDGEVLLEPP
jgi:hypothetical protein